VTAKCPKCHSDNTDTQRFCGECGTPLDLPGDLQVSPTKTLETPREELTTGSTFAGRYQIVEELGQGGMGRVYRALDRKINEEVALKLIKPEIASERRTLERFGNELKIARRIAHKNVGRMYHLSEEKGTHYITMEYVPGEDLKRMIRMSKQLSIATAVDIAKQISEGLAEAHRLGIVHRDLKPGNIMIDREGNARIMDFGIARLLSAKGITGAGVAIGTPEYMSPEQVDGKEADPRADIYSLGIILYEMVTGRVPFEGDTPYAVGFKHKSEQPVSPMTLNPQVPDELSGLILKCLEKAQDGRPQTADELRVELEKIQKGMPTTVHAIPVAKRRPLTSREITIKFTAKKLLFPGLALVALAAVIIVAVIFLPHRSPPQRAGPIHRQITFTGNSSSPAISPDGKFLAYTDNIAVNEQKVMVQDMIGGQTIEVARGRNCGGLRWSPDGSELSFYVQKSDLTWATWIVPRLGGKPREFDGVEFAAWSPDGTQFAYWSWEKKQLSFTNRTTGELKSISFDKSIPPYVADLDWSPSGKLILLCMYNDNDSYSIWTVTADGSRQNKIIEDPINWVGSARWSPRGDAFYYLHGREQTTDIRKILISPDTGKPSRSPSSILEGHEVGEYFTLTKDGKNLAYTRETSSSNLWLASLEGSGKNQKVNLKPLTTGTLTTMIPNFSPDGKLVAYASGSGNTSNIYIMPAEGGPSQQITFMNSWNGGPVWSPDGKEIAFVSNQGGTTKIWKVSAAGGKPRQFDKTEGYWPTWAPGRKILHQTPSGSNLKVLDPVTGEATALLKTDSAGGIFWPTWSPDGKRIAVRWKKGPETGSGIWVLSFDDSSEVILRKGNATPISWSADGKWVYAWEAVSGACNILAISSESGQAELLSTLPLSSDIGTVFRFHTVDGKRFIFSGRKSQSDVWVIENFDPEIK
jgi:serine/threonine protein kinase